MKIAKLIFHTLGFTGFAIAIWIALANLFTPLPQFTLDGVVVPETGFFINFPMDHFDQLAVISIIFIGVYMIFHVITSILSNDKQL